MLSSLAPGTTAALGGNVNAGIQPQRIGGGGAANIMMDGVSTMDLASNRPSLQMNVESIGEVKIARRVTRRSTAALRRAGHRRDQERHEPVPRSVYDVERNSEWNANSRVNVLNGDAEAVGART